MPETNMKLGKARHESTYICYRESHQVLKDIQFRIWIVKKTWVRKRFTFSISYITFGRLRCR